MTTIVEVAYDPVDRRFVCECAGCGWSGVTSEMHVIATVLGEHARGCEGQRHKRAQTYDADLFANFQRGGPRSVNDEPEPKAQPSRKPPTPRGQPREKLNAELVRQIRQRAAAGESLTKIAAAFDITTSNASMVVRRKTWTHVE